MSALAQAIEAHRGAVAAVEALRDLLARKELKLDAALEAVARASCGGDAEFLQQKLGYLHAYKRQCSGEPNIRLEFGALAIAIDERFDARDATAA